MSPRGSLLLLALLGSLALTWTGCGRAQQRYLWEKQLLEADHAYDDGRHSPARYQEARAAYLKLRPDAPLPKFTRYVDLRLAMIDEQEGALARALRGYGALWEGQARDEVAARAGFLAGRLLYRRGEQERALALWESVVVAMPERVWAEEAWRSLLRHHEGDARQRLRLIARLYDAVGDSTLGDNLLYQRARILWEEGELEAARDAFEVMIRRHPGSGLRHEARWSVARLEMSLGDAERALLYLRILAEDRDDSWQVGIYESDLADDARFWRGLLLARALDRPVQASQEFALFLEDFPTSLLRDDARWNLAVLAARRGEQGQAREHCQALREEDPASRWVRRCQEAPGRAEDLSDAGVEDFDWEEVGP